MWKRRALARISDCGTKGNNETVTPGGNAQATAGWGVGVRGASHKRRISAGAMVIEGHGHISSLRHRTVDVTERDRWARQAVRASSATRLWAIARRTAVPLGHNTLSAGTGTLTRLRRARVLVDVAVASEIARWECL
jgi:hypothetical protein